MGNLVLSLLLRIYVYIDSVNLTIIFDVYIIFGHIVQYYIINLLFIILLIVHLI